MEMNAGNVPVENIGKAAADVKSNAFAKVKSFLWHLLQMVLAMEAGMVANSALLGTLLAGTGYDALTRKYPVFGYWMMVVAMTLPMVALMRYYHKASWRYCLEMAAAMAAPAVALTILVQVGLLPAKPFLGCGISDPLMVLAMAGYMLVRPMPHNHGKHATGEPDCH